MVVTEYDYPVPYSIALLSDLHNRPYEQIIRGVNKVSPDIIAITGDVIDGHKPKDNEPITLRQKNVLPFLKACSEISPTFFSYGNHEWMLCDEDEKLITETGVTVLDNMFVQYKELVIGGLTSARKTSYVRFKNGLENSLERYPLFTESSEESIPDTNWLEQFVRFHGFKLLLCHHPEYQDQYLKDFDIDLILAGHCHGGQIRIFDHGLFAPGQGWWPSKTKGSYGNMVISAGLSNTGGIVPRLFNPKEIVYISKFI